jgi:hypothetical protein
MGLGANEWKKLPASWKFAVSWSKPYAYWGLEGSTSYFEASGHFFVGFFCWLFLLAFWDGFLKKLF